MKDYSYLDYDTIAPLLIPPLLPPKRHNSRLLQNSTAPLRISSLATLMPKALKTGAKPFA